MKFTREQVIEMAKRDPLCYACRKLANAELTGSPKASQG